jgi:hypothetical protein
VDLKKVPEESEKHIRDLNKNLEKIENERSKEEKKVEEVMANMKIETQVRIARVLCLIFCFGLCGCVHMLPTQHKFDYPQSTSCRCVFVLGKLLNEPKPIKVG